jgi:predicted nucleic acid-binding protein
MNSGLKMSKTAVFDTRFFAESYYTSDSEISQKITEKIKTTKERFISSIVLHEFYQLTLKMEGRETAKLRSMVIEQDFTVVDVNANLARASAELRLKYRMSMGDSIIAATALLLKVPCVTDDSHFKAVKEIKTDWI